LIHTLILQLNDSFQNSLGEIISPREFYSYFNYLVLVSSQVFSQSGQHTHLCSDLNTHE
jgi:hypothetical protein